MAAYRRHPYVRSLPDPPVIWQESEARLLDYGGSGPTLLVIPSLINRAYVLDLAPERSMLRVMAASGVHPLLLDWGWPGPAERRFTLTDYIVRRLDPAMAAVAGPVVLVGYCMGGLLALAAALRQPERVRGLALLATPWDFQAAAPNAAKQGKTLGQQAAALPPGGAFPVDSIQAMFAMADPHAVPEKYRAFCRLDPASERARMFVALEDWLADGIPLAAPVAYECLAGWYGANAPAAGQWLVDGKAVMPSRWLGPSLVVVPNRDRIVPPESAIALARSLGGQVTTLRPAAGHVGMVAGARAREQLWQPALDWFGGL